MIRSSRPSRREFFYRPEDYDTIPIPAHYPVTSLGRTFMDPIPKLLYALTEAQFTRLAEQRSHDKKTQQAFAKFMAIASQGGKPRVFLSGFSEFTILDEGAPATSELLKNLGKSAIRYKI